MLASFAEGAFVPAGHVVALDGDLHLGLVGRSGNMFMTAAVKQQTECAGNWSLRPTRLRAGSDYG
jgi:hypothetical protein